MLLRFVRLSRIVIVQGACHVEVSTPHAGSAGVVCVRRRSPAARRDSHDASRGPDRWAPCVIGGSGQVTVLERLPGDGGAQGGWRDGPPGKSMTLCPCAPGSERAWVMRYRIEMESV